MPSHGRYIYSGCIHTVPYIPLCPRLSPGGSCRTSGGQQQEQVSPATGGRCLRGSSFSRHLFFSLVFCVAPPMTCRSPCPVSTYWRSNEEGKRTRTGRRPAGGREPRENERHGRRRLHGAAASTRSVLPPIFGLRRGQEAVRLLIAEHGTSWNKRSMAWLASNTELQTSRY